MRSNQLRINVLPAAAEKNLSMCNRCETQHGSCSTLGMKTHTVRLSVASTSEYAAHACALSLSVTCMAKHTPLTFLQLSEVVCDRQVRVCNPCTASVVVCEMHGNISNPYMYSAVVCGCL
eukprot:m.61872 g.61872  ORF g.61872 m.61872 type:complete len:120 (-) comp15778_c0_seq6:164-523(-)